MDCLSAIPVQYLLST